MMERAGSLRWRLSSRNCSSVALKSLSWIPSLRSVSHSEPERLRVRLRLSKGVKEMPQNSYYSILFYSSESLFITAYLSSIARKNGFVLSGCHCLLRVVRSSIISKLLYSKHHFKIFFNLLTAAYFKYTS